MTPWIAAHQASLPLTLSQSLLKLMSIDSVKCFCIKWGLGSGVGPVSSTFNLLHHYGNGLHWNVPSNSSTVPIYQLMNPKSKWTWRQSLPAQRLSQGWACHWSSLSFLDNMFASSPLQSCSTISLQVMTKVGWGEGTTERGSILWGPLHLPRIQARSICLIPSADYFVRKADQCISQEKKWGHHQCLLSCLEEAPVTPGLQWYNGAELDKTHLMHQARGP